MRRPFAVRATWVGVAALLVAVDVTAGVALGHWLDPTHAASDRDGEPAPLVAGWSPRVVPSFVAVDQDDRTFTDSDLLGHVWIVDFIFTRCLSACPLLTTRMLALQRRLSSTDVQFASISVDPTYDRPEILKAYADRWRGDQHRWRLLTTDVATSRRLASGFAEADDSADDFSHSDRFTLVDATGQLRGSFGSTERSEQERLIEAATRMIGARTALAGRGR
ncbi:MAG TPA: SCO family protein [Polyangia bacterium]|nr:SCO family protein [Polyangia bacterium]